VDIANGNHRGPQQQLLALLEQERLRQAESKAKERMALGMLSEEEQYLAIELGITGLAFLRLKSVLGAGT
jgi:hypothetical protein